MNKEAERLGLGNSHFTNPTGYADPAQYMSARDLAMLAGYLIREFPEYYKIYSRAGVHLEQDPAAQPQPAPRR